MENAANLHRVILHTVKRPIPPTISETILGLHCPHKPSLVGNILHDAPGCTSNRSQMRTTAPTAKEARTDAPIETPCYK